jgi:hypothetical protein
MSTARRHLRWSLGATLLLALFAAPRAGLGACGDYLYHATGAALGTQRQEGEKHSPLRPAPCRGPHCSGRMPLPPIPAAPKFTPVGPRQAIYWLVQIPADEAAGLWNLDQAIETHSVITAGRLFRPPRAS